MPSEIRDEPEQRPNQSTPDEIERDPQAYIRRVAERTRALHQYTVVFTREERRGLLKTLQGPERIACAFRRDPFSVYMKWLDEDVKYGESVYVAGAAGNKVRFVPRNGFLGLEPSITSVDLQTPVTWGESRYPLTDFGLERLMERTLKTMAEAGSDVHVAYVGLEAESDGRAVHHLRLSYLPSRFPVCTHDLYIDAATDLPAATILKTESGRLEASYKYAQLVAAIALTDLNFTLEAERRGASAGTAAASVR